MMKKKATTKYETSMQRCHHPQVPRTPFDFRLFHPLGEVWLHRPLLRAFDD